MNETLWFMTVSFGDTINSVHAYPINKQGVSEPINMSLNLLKGNIPEKKRNPSSFLHPSTKDGKERESLF